MAGGGGRRAGFESSSPRPPTLSRFTAWDAVALARSYGRLAAAGALLAVLVVTFARHRLSAPCDPLPAYDVLPVGTERPPAPLLAMPTGKIGYVTLMADDMYSTSYSADPAQYGEALLVWLSAIRDAGSVLPVLIGMTPKMEQLLGARFRAAGADVRPIAHLENKLSHVPGSFVKLRVWEFDDYEKLVYVDSDFLVLQNMDPLFSYPDFAATKDFLPTDSYSDFPYDGFNAGMFVFKPSKAVFNDMVAAFETCPWHFTDGKVRTEQEFMNWYFQDWHRIPPRYALSLYTIVFHGRHPTYVPEAFDASTTVAIHMFCKPWNAACDAKKGDKATDYKWVHDTFWRQYDKVFPAGGILRNMSATAAG